eukprot:640273-Pleurochrysis_carterae.AAC.1
MHVIDKTLVTDKTHKIDGMRKSSTEARVDLASCRTSHALSPRLERARALAHVRVHVRACVLVRMRTRVSPEHSSARLDRVGDD